MTSRKLWTAVVGIIVGLAAAFGLPDNDIAQIAGIVASAMSVVSYITGESKVDAAAAYGRNISEETHKTVGKEKIFPEDPERFSSR